MGFVECTLPHDKVMNFQNHNVLFCTMIMLKTNFKKFSGNSKEDTFKSSSTMKVVDQESIRQRKFKANKQGNSEQSAKTFKVSQKKKTKKNKKKKKKRKKTISSMCCRTPIEGCNPKKILKWT